MIFPDTLESRTYTWFEFHREFDMIVQLSNIFLRERFMMWLLQQTIFIGLNKQLEDEQHET